MMAELVLLFVLDCYFFGFGSDGKKDERNTLVEIY